MAKEFDIVILGVTGFTGRLVADYFSQTISHEHPDLRWAIAGRSASKLAAVKSSIEAQFPGISPEILLCDNDDQASVDKCISRTRVIITTAGPYLKRGTPIVDACVRLGTDYVDLSGETPYAASLIDRYHHAAEAAGVHIVPMSGYDSIPSDLGVLFAVNQVRDRWDQPTRSCKSVCNMAGQLSGGTLATGIEMGRDFPEAAALAKEPFAMGGGTVPRAEDMDLQAAVFDETAQCWTMPFMMATINTRVVRRSNAWLHYGLAFGYQEVAKAPSQEVAEKVAAAEKRSASKESWKMAAKMRDAGKLPKQGEGPSEEVRAKSWFSHDIYAEAADGRKLVCRVSGGDPGYGETAKMVAQSALCLLFDKERLARKGGVLTSAAAGGTFLIDRLNGAGIKFEFVKELPVSVASKL